MKEWLKVIITILLLIVFVLALDKATNYQARMKQYNAHVCAVNGYEPDCKTPLK